MTSCDNRNPITRSRSQASFAAEITVVKDFSQRRDLSEIQFRRNGQAFSDAKISIGEDTLNSSGSGVYYAQTPNLLLRIPTNTITFSVPADVYLKTVSFDLPDSFGVTSVNPRYNQNGSSVTLQWSHPNRTTGFIMSVVSANYPADGTSPLTRALSSTATSFVIPDTTFETSTGNLVAGIYYIYVVAYNGGFGPYSGISFPLPSGLPARSISEPTGHIRVGTVAPVDSVIIPL